MPKIDLEKKGDERRAARVKELLNPILEELGVAQQYNISLGFGDVVESERKLKMPDPEHKGCCAITRDDYPSHEISVWLQRDYLDDSSDERLVQVLLHEIMHTIPFGRPVRFVTSLLEKAHQTDDEWACLEEETVDLVAMWLARLWLRGEYYRKCPSTRTAAKSVKAK